MSGVSVDAVAFRRRVGHMQEALEHLGVDAWVAVLGKGDAGTQATATALHVWLLGYPFSNAAIIVTKEKVVVVATAKQSKYLEGLANSRVSLVPRPKDVSESVQVLDGQLSSLHSSSDPNVPAKVAILAQDTPEGELAGEWAKLIKDKFADPVDGTAQFATLRRAKDEAELRAVRTASKAGAGIMARYFAEEMTKIVDEEREVSNSQLAKKVSATIDSTKLLNQLRLGPDFDASRLDWSEQPSINWGRDGNLGPGATTCELRLNYKSYHSCVARSYLIDAPKSDEQLYSVLLAIQRKLLSTCHDGVTCSELYEAALGVAKERDQALVDAGKFPAVLGYGVGIEGEDPALEIKQGNPTVLKDGFVLVVKLEVEGLRLSDTVRVTGDIPIVFTDAPKNREDVCFTIQGDDVKVEDEDAPRSQRAPRKARADLKREATESAELAMEAHQKELKARLQEYGLHKYKESEDDDGEEAVPQFKKFEAYHRETQLPNLENLRIKVDERAQAIILPVAGRPVPFHINTYKNGSANDEGDYVYLRLNFNTPDSLTTKRDEVPYDNPNANFVKSVTLRSRDGQRMRDTLKKIQDLKREVSRKENEKKQLADVVQQDKLVEIKERRPQRLEPIFVRPMPEGKRVPGALEIHRNGLRFTSPIKEQQVDVLFSNVSHLFYQPCDRELIVLIHCHLSNPIMIGKRKTQDVQFYRDVTDAAFDDTGSRKRKYVYGDEDELEQEREERRRRVQLNKEFLSFAELIAKGSNGKLDVDVPFRELGFNGVPFRSSVFLQPTTGCLVQLSETPFLVVTLSEVEVAVLERVRFGLKQFDLVLVYHDYKKPPTQINSIPVTQLDAVRSWLNEVDIPFFDAELNFNWKEIMSMISSAPHAFFAEDGGWSFLEPADEEGNEDDEDSDEGEEEFHASEVSADDDDEDEYSSGEGSAVSENSYESELSDDGEDWSELEEEAAREDRKKNRE